MEPGDVVYNPETLLKLREAVGTEEIACNLDPGHLFYRVLSASVHGLNPKLC